MNYNVKMNKKINLKKKKNNKYITWGLPSYMQWDFEIRA